MTALSKAVQQAEVFLARYDAAMEDPEQNQALVAQQDAMPLAESLRSVLAALSSPPAEDVREARRWIEDLLSRNGFGADYSAEELDVWAIELLGTVRPYGTVTDTEVDAAVKAWWEYGGSGPGAQGHAMRAALEAAREARS